MDDCPLGSDERPIVWYIYRQVLTKHHLMHYGKPLAGKYVRVVDRCCWSPQTFHKKFHQTSPPTPHTSFVIPTLGPHGSTLVHGSHTAPLPFPRWSLVNPASSSLGLSLFGRSRCKGWPPPLQGFFSTLRSQIILFLPFNLHHSMEVLWQFLNF